MITRRHLASLFASGELAALVRQHKTTRALAAHLGMHRDALRGLMDRMRAAGELPGWGELRGDFLDEIEHERATVRQSSNIQKPDSSLAQENSRVPDMGTAAPNPGRWPSVEAFDAETVKPVVPVGHIIKGVSTLVDGETGEIKQQWVKTTQQDDERLLWMQAIRDLADDLPRFEPAPPIATPPAELLSVFAVGDMHIGALAWHEDAGENFDMEIAERDLVAAFGRLIKAAPDGSRALMIFIGDNVHADGQNNTTTRGTRVDVDGRTIKMMRVAVRTIRRAIGLALAKHSHVTVIIERGNHDELLSAMLALALSLLFENEPRVTVDVSPEVFHWFRFGSVLIGTHHGDRVKPVDLLGVMAVDRKTDWGETKHRRFYCGHLHHLQTKEMPGMIVETLPTLAGSDAWHRAMGYRSQRAMYMDVYHPETGLADRHFVRVDQLR